MKSHMFTLIINILGSSKSEYVIDKLDQINTKQNAKRISTFDFSILYTNLPHKDLSKVLFDLIGFCFNESFKKVIFCLKNAFWSNNPKTKSLFTKSSLKITVQFLIENSHFTVGDVILLQTVDIPMGIGPVPFWGNLYSYNYKSKSINK